MKNNEMKTDKAGDNVINTLKAIAEGGFVNEQDELLISESRLEFICSRDEQINGKFTIESSIGTDIRGIIYTSNYRMECHQKHFAGKKVEIEYSFDLRGMADKATIKGDIFIVSNLGEYNLPFVVTVLNKSVESSVGVIRNLFHFTNLAYYDYEQAYKLFVSKKFSMINMENSERMIYKMLVSSNPCREHLEEFLLAVNKKKPVTVELQESELNEIYQGDDFAMTVTLRKNTWGYLKLLVSSDADFIRIEKERISAEDFVGNELDYSFIIDGGKLHAGKNIAKITFLGYGQEKNLFVTVDYPCKREQGKRELENIKVKLCQLYISVRTHQINNTSWVRESKELAERWMSFAPDNNMLKLFYAHLLILDKRKSDADFILDKLKKDRYLKRNEPQIYSYLLYIEALNRQQKEFTLKALEEIKALLEIHPHSFGIFFVQLFLDDELQNNPVRKYQMLHEHFVYGCHSPFLYLEAILLIKAEDYSVISQLGSFEKMILSFALKHDIVTQELAVLVAKLSLVCKDYDELLCRILKQFYNRFENIEIIEAVCSQLIKGGKRSQKDFEWYELGVNAQLKLNLLYEYYLYTIPMDKKEILPKHLMMYFTYNQNIDYRHKAYLFANISRHRETVPLLYEKYEPYINEFVLEQMLKSHVTEDLMYLYELHIDFLLENSKCQEILEKLIFTNVIEYSGEKMRRVIIGYDEVAKVEAFPFSDKKAFVRIYTDSAFIALEDMSGKLHFKCRSSQDNALGENFDGSHYPVDFEIKPLLNRSHISNYAGRLPKKSLGILLNRYNKTGVILENEGVSICEKLLEMDEITPKFELEIIIRLIDIFEDKQDEKMVRKMLERLDFSLMDTKQRALYIEKMILCKMYDSAYELVFKYGFEYINPKYLVRLCSRKIENEITDEKLTALTAYVFFCGKYNEEMLKYLSAEFYGSTYEMITLWSAANNFNMDSYKIGERILVQMIYTGFMPAKASDIFKDYCNNVHNEELVSVFLTYLSYQYIVNKQVVDAEIFDYILKLWKQEDELSLVSKTAFIKYCSKKEKLSDDELLFVKNEFPVLEKKGIRFNFLKTVARLANIETSITERVIVEHLANPKCRVELYYRILNYKNDDSAFLKETLSPMLGPVFAKEITLFYGESLQYYVKEKYAGSRERIVCSGIVFQELDEIDIKSGRYGWLNDMYLSRSLKDEISLLDLMNRYNEYEVITNKLFELKE